MHGILQNHLALGQNVRGDGHAEARGDLTGHEACLGTVFGTLDA